MTNQELKPCPFCGGKAILEPYRNGWSIAHVCMMIDPVWFPDKQEAVECWNARPGTYELEQLCRDLYEDLGLIGERSYINAMKDLGLLED